MTSADKSQLPKSKPVRCVTPGCSRFKDLNEDGLCPRCIASIAAISKAGKVPQYPCNVCKRECEEKDRSLLCDICEHWTHSTCVKMSEEEYNLIQRFNLTLNWYCSDKCWGRVRDAVENAHHLETKFNVLHSEFKDMQMKFVAMEEKVKGRVFSEIGAAVNENNDIERRKMNLIISDLPETEGYTNSGWDDDKTREHDLAAILKLTKDEFGLEVTSSIDRVIRLGFKDKTKADSRPRPIKVTFNDIKVKRDVLKKGKLLRESSNTAHRKIFINPDLTEAQRIKDAKLREEMWQAREVEDRNVIIQQGKLVEVDYPVRKSRSNAVNKPKKKKPNQATKKHPQRFGPYIPTKPNSGAKKVETRKPATAPSSQNPNSQTRWNTRSMKLHPSRELDGMPVTILNTQTDSGCMPAMPPANTIELSPSLSTVQEDTESNEDTQFHSGTSNTKESAKPIIIEEIEPEEKAPLKVKPEKEPLIDIAAH